VLGRWPLLFACVAALGTAVGVDLGTSDGALLLVEALTVTGATFGGAFIYAEGARWRERREHDDAG
jgi:hypothetical protein